MIRCKFNTYGFTSHHVRTTFFPPIRICFIWACRALTSFVHRWRVGHGFTGELGPCRGLLLIMKRTLYSFENGALPPVPRRSRSTRGTGGMASFPKQSSFRFVRSLLPLMNQNLHCFENGALPPVPRRPRSPRFPLIYLVGWSLWFAPLRCALRCLTLICIDLHYVALS